MFALLILIIIINNSTYFGDQINKVFARNEGDRISTRYIFQKIIYI